MPTRSNQRTRKPASARTATGASRPRTGPSGPAPTPLPTDPATAARRAERLAAAFAALPEVDLDLLLGDVPLPERVELARSLGVTVDPRYARGGLGRLLRPRLLNRPVTDHADYGVILTRRLGEATAAFLGERLDQPAQEDITGLCAELVASFPAPAVRLFFAAIAARSCPASPHLDATLDGDERLAVASPAAGAPADAGAEPDAGGDDPDGQDPVGDGGASADAFSPLDELIVRTIVRTHTGTTGAPDPDALRLVVDEVLHLSTERAASYHHLGFLSAFDPATPRPDPPAMDPERWRWYRFGRLCGFAAQGNHAGLLAAAEEREAEAVAIMGDSRMGPRLAGELIAAVLPARADLAARLLAATAPGTADGVLVSVGERAGELLAQRQAAEAETLLLALLPHHRSDGDAGPETVRATCLLSAARRAANDFPGAAATLAGLPDTPARRPGDVTARLEWERGLLAGGFGRLGHVHPGRHDDERAALAARLRAGQGHFAAALAACPDDPVAAYCLGMLALTEGRPADAADLLSRADGRAGRAEPELAPLLPVARFHRGLAGLESLDPAVEGPSYQVLVAALDEGFSVTPAELARAVCALQAQRSPRSGPFLLRAVAATPEPALLLAPAAELARTADAAAVEAAARLGADRRLARIQRFEALAAALTGAGLLGRREDLDAYCEALDDLVTKACDPELDTAWEQLLADNDHLREALGSAEAELERIAVLRRAGDLGPARTVALRCFHRALAGEFAPYDAADLWALLGELGTETEELPALGSLLPAGDEERDASDAPGPARPVRIVFVGGHETQGQWHGTIDTEVDRLFDGQVQVDWFGGFPPDWKKTLDQARARLRSADALVLMPYVRTNLGRHLRAAAGQAGLPWIPCTAKGRGSLLAAVQRAVTVVTQLRAGAASG